MDIEEIKTCLYRKVRLTSRKLAHYFDDDLKSLNLKGTQFTLLASIYYNPNSCITQLSKNLEIERTALTRSINPLIKRGLVISKSSEVGNSKMISLTDKGLNLLEKAFVIWKKRHDMLKSRLSEDEIDQLLYLFDKVTAI